MPKSTLHRCLVLLLALVAGACAGAADDEVGGGSASNEASTADVIPEDAIAVRASTDTGLGRERVLIGVSDLSGERLVLPDVAAVIEVAPVDEPTAIQRTEATWTWIVLNGIGLYRGQFDFDTPGIYSATLVFEDGRMLDPIFFEVFAEPSAPALGETVPAAPTPTLDELTIDELTTDPNPVEAFYELSVADALANGQRTVLVFSTPAYCRTSACGPLLDNVKEIAPLFDEVNFVHVEVFTNLADPAFAPDAAHLSPYVGPEWFNLPSEPWVFVLDPDGTVIGRFEGVLDPSEITQILG